ncbi:MAG TPA: 2-oxoacid:acceptor oxidoreductase family protein [Spirochaetia bacterium]|nr:2-oxoacid:acceptor oxidoreductase family protein [Spirochaetia bacterium]
MARFGGNDDVVPLSGLAGRLNHLGSDWYAVQSQSYGPEAWGGASKAEVILSDAPVDYPMVIAANLLLGMNQEFCDCYLPVVKKNGIVILDSTNVARTSPTWTAWYHFLLRPRSRRNCARRCSPTWWPWGSLPH